MQKSSVRCVHVDDDQVTVSGLNRMFESGLFSTAELAALTLRPPTTAQASTSTPFTPNFFERQLLPAAPPATVPQQHVSQQFAAQCHFVPQQHFLLQHQVSPQHFVPQRTPQQQVAPAADFSNLQEMWGQPSELQLNGLYGMGMGQNLLGGSGSNSPFANSPLNMSHQSPPAPVPHPLMSDFDLGGAV